MRSSLLLVAVLAAATFGGGCRSNEAGPQGHTAANASAEGVPLERSITDYRVIWTSGARLGYLKTYDVRQGRGSIVPLHFVENLDFEEIGWVANDGRGEAYRTAEDDLASARREPFARVELPNDSIENNVRRILGLDPLAEISFLPATPDDIRR